MRFNAFFKHMLIPFMIIFITAAVPAQTVLADDAEKTDVSGGDTLQKAAEERAALPIQSNEVEGWPAGPQIGAESAILIDADSDAILYAKNIHEHLYPASTTKLLTCLLAAENGNLDDMVTFSQTAVSSVPQGGSNMGMDAGQSVTLEQCLYGIMVGSANEAANAVAEYVSGSIPKFTELMNKRAAELGCTDSHFVNANGIHDDNHYTSAYDLSLIAAAFFKNGTLAKIGNTPRYHFTPTATQPDDFYLKNKHKLITHEIACDGILGGKTGYTDQARETLVTCAQRGGIRLICVVMKEESPDQFNDTVSLFDYGFSNFSKVNISDHESEYDISGEIFSQSGVDLFGSSAPMISVDPDSYVILPNSADFSDTKSSIIYPRTSAGNSGTVADIRYTYHGAFIGEAAVNISGKAVSAVASQKNSQSSDPEYEKTVFINVKAVLIAVAGLMLIYCLVVFIRDTVKSYNFAYRNINRARHVSKRRHRGSSHDIDF
jgi:D-alanyl-D-alanine carboxypeptidase (penicillin-binding protein 5/6)